MTVRRLQHCPFVPTVMYVSWLCFPWVLPASVNMMGFLAWCDMGLPNQQMLAPGHPLGWLKPPETWPEVWDFSTSQGSDMSMWRLSPPSLTLSFFPSLEGIALNQFLARFSFDRIFASWKDFLGGASGKEPACWCRRQKRRGSDPWVWTIPLEEGMATHSSILAWRILWTEELGRLWSIEPQRVQRYNWSDLACTHCFLNTWSNKGTHSQMFPGGVSQMGGWGLQTAALWEPCGAKGTNTGV